MQIIQIPQSSSHPLEKDIRTYTQCSGHKPHDPWEYEFRGRRYRYLANLKDPSCRSRSLDRFSNRQIMATTLADLGIRSGGDDGNGSGSGVRPEGP